jgi:hypothetical protein
MRDKHQGATIKSTESRRGLMSADRAVVQVTGRLSSGTLAQLEVRDARLHRQTLVRLDVRDEAALQGVLRRLHDLGLELVEIRSLDDSPYPRPMEIMVNGPIGDLTLASLSDYTEVSQTATRITFSDPAALSGALALLVAQGLTVEYATAPYASKGQPT